MKVNTLLFVIVLILSTSFINSKKLKTNTTCTCPTKHTLVEGECRMTKGMFPWLMSDGFTDAGMFNRCQAVYGTNNCEKLGAIVYSKCPQGTLRSSITYCYTSCS